MRMGGTETRLRPSFKFGNQSRSTTTACHWRVARFSASRNAFKAACNFGGGRPRFTAGANALTFRPADSLSAQRSSVCGDGGRPLPAVATPAPSKNCRPVAGMQVPRTSNKNGAPRRCHVWASSLRTLPPRVTNARLSQVSGAARTARPASIELSAARLNWRTNPLRESRKKKAHQKAWKHGMRAFSYTRREACQKGTRRERTGADVPCRRSGWHGPRSGRG